jgi:nicotinamide-nucleotide amidase
MAEALDPAIPSDIDALAREVLELACGAELKLVTAESCTGGMLASLLTDMPGQSHAFERGFVTYTNESKHELLGVAQDILDGPGAVSEPSARAMAEGALANSRGDVALSITGYAEEDPQSGKPAGLVHFGLARRDANTGHQQMLYGDIGRAEVRVRSLRTALEMMRDALKPMASRAEVSAEG